MKLGSLITDYVDAKLLKGPTTAIKKKKAVLTSPAAMDEPAGAWGWSRLMEIHVTMLKDRLERTTDASIGANVLQLCPAD